MTSNLFLFKGYFGRLDYRKNIIAPFEVHSLDRTSRDNRRHSASRSSDQTSDTTLSETIFSIVPANRFRMLVLTLGLLLQFAQ